jgi:Zn-dependent peptidase ImmA (M78 family)/DNA-binding XRE family transcriptional regulator
MTVSGSIFPGERLRLARIFNGLSQADLGGRVDVTHASVSQAENGIRQPSAVVVDRLAVALGVDRSFFYLPAPVEFRDEECHFRRRKTTPLGVRNRVLATGTLFNELIALLDASVRLPAYDVPTIRAKTPVEIEKAAEECRVRWQLGLDAPIKNVARVLERAGIVIARFAADAFKVDAFSRSGPRGVIVLNMDKGSTSRARFDKSHECGHLVMHSGADALSDDAEAEANRFGSAFLMPRAAFTHEFPRLGTGRIRFDALYGMKERWRVSLAAIVRRAHDLKLIAAAQYEAAFKSYYANHLHRVEPHEPPDEPPEVVPLAFEVLQQQGVTREDVVRRLGWTVATLARVAPDVFANEDVGSVGGVIPFAQLKSRRPVRL